MLATAIALFFISVASATPSSTVTDGAERTEILPFDSYDAKGIQLNPYGDELECVGNYADRDLALYHPVSIEQVDDTSGVDLVIVFKAEGNPDSISMNVQGYTDFGYNPINGLTCSSWFQLGFVMSSVDDLPRGFWTGETVTSSDGRQKAFELEFVTLTQSGNGYARSIPTRINGWDNLCMQPYGDMRRYLSATAKAESGGLVCFDTNKLVVVR